MNMLLKVAAVCMPPACVVNVSVAVSAAAWQVD
jgi:hypothetical protein